MMATQARTADPADIAAAREANWRVDTREAARQAGVPAEHIERMTFWAWRLRRDHAEPDRARVILGKPRLPVQEGGE
jgi:hypothetical protein